MCVVLSHQVGGSLAQQRWAADIVSTLEMGVTVRELGVTKGQEDMCPREGMKGWLGSWEGPISCLQCSLRLNELGKLNEWQSKRVYCVKIIAQST